LPAQNDHYETHTHTHMTKCLSANVRTVIVAFAQSYKHPECWRPSRNTDSIWQPVVWTRRVWSGHWSHQSDFVQLHCKCRYAAHMWL